MLAPCCDRAEALLARVESDETKASAAFERALAGFEALRALTELAATQKLLINVA
jgi:hypothetical protein